MTKTMTDADRVTFGKQISTSDVSDTAFALVDEQGMVVAWTQAAEHLVGYRAGEVVGRSIALVLPTLGEASAMSALVARCRAQNGWSGASVVRHRNGRVVDVNVRFSLVRGRDGATRWLASVTEMSTLSREVVNGSVGRSVLDRAPIGVVVRDLELRCTWMNDVVESHNGISRERRLGYRMTDSWPGIEAEVAEAVMRRVLRSGSTKVHEYRTWLPTSASRGEERPFAVSFSCLQGADGRGLGVCVISVDLTESLRERERLALLEGAGTSLGSSLDVMQTGQELADLAVPQFADFVAVDLEESVPFGEGPPVRIGSIGERCPVLRRAGVASIRPGVPEAAWRRGESVHIPPASPFIDVLLSGRSQLLPVLSTSLDSWIGRDTVRAQKIRETGMHSAMVVPIRTRRTLLGVALFIRTNNPVPFQEADLLLAEELVSRAAVSLDNARQYCREHAAGLVVQRSLLPRRLKGGMAVEAMSRYLPADIDRGVGGDWFDVIPLSGARVALVVGDVVGHGIHAATKMGKLRAAVHTLSGLDMPPDELLAHLDHTVQLVAEGESDEPDQSSAAVGTTCLYAVYDPVTRRCTMAAAGHPPPAIIDPNGQVTFPDLPTGAPLGLGLAVPFEAVELELPEGTLLALYTDGLIETRGQDIEDGMHRLGTALAQPDLPLEELCTRALDTVQEQAATDDTSLLLVRTRSLSPAQVASWTLPGEDTAVGGAQDLAAAQLGEWALDGLVNPVKLIVGELVANAVRHSNGPIGLRLIQHEHLTIEISDADTSVWPSRNARVVDKHGPGLAKVARLARRWGIRPAQDGKVVWAETDLTRASGK